MNQEKDNSYIKVILSCKPKRKPNLVRWMIKHGISSNVMSTDNAIPLAIERQYMNDRN